MLAAICEFFKSGKSPVPRDRRWPDWNSSAGELTVTPAGGKPVKLADIIERAKKKSEASTESIGGDKQ